MIIEAHTTASGDTCPSCGVASDAVHSSYTRTLHDLPVSEYVVCLKITVRRFRCRNEHCTRRTFVEALADVAERYARRTTRLNTALWHIGQIGGGQCGAYLAMCLRMPTSRHTLLRLLRRHATTLPVAPRVIGVDDWAKRRGQSYGTIVVDLERHQVLDLLPERTAKTLAHWLAHHPSVEIVTRDRSGEYALGIQIGAPQAIQIADRWHLFKNLTDMAERALQELPSSLRLHVSPPATTTARREKFPRAQSDVKRQCESRQRRLNIYQRIQYLKEQGYGQRQIARALGHSRGLVRRYYNASQFPEAQPRFIASILDPYLDFLEERYVAGCTQAPQLWREIQSLGYPGSESQVSKWLQNRRKRTEGAVVEMSDTASSAQRPIVLPSLSSSKWLLSADPAYLKLEEQVLLGQLLQVPELHLLYQLIQRLKSLIREQRAELLDDWLTDASASGIAACARFAASLQQDYGAVRSALELPWSNGQTEGQVHRLKFLKRQMYGRAKLDLLRLRMLYVRA